jgi:hypothetical protein
LRRNTGRAAGNTAASSLAITSNGTSVKETVVGAAWNDGAQPPSTVPGYRSSRAKKKLTSPAQRSMRGCYNPATFFRSLLRHRG